uniref:Serpentine receptor class gamma n=1 Tax=Meloidogyne floridensis TaxID=298350 RepID=A0A915NQH4_9BILA
MGFFLSAPIVFLANTVYLPFVISLVIGVPSVILYSFEVFIIITKWKDFNSSFFQLLIARAILNILYFIISFGQRFAKVGLFTNVYLQLPSWVLATIFFFRYYDLYARLQADNQTVTIDIRHTTTIVDVNPAEDAAYSCVIFMFICLIINIATLFVYKTKVQSQTTQIASNVLQKAIEKRLILYAFWTFVGQLLISISMTLIYISVTIAVTGVTLLSYDENQNFYLVKS